AVGLALLEAGEQIQIAVVVDVRPGVRLRSRCGKEIRLHGLERHGSLRERRHDHEYFQQTFSSAAPSNNRRALTHAGCPLRDSLAPEAAYLHIDRGSDANAGNRRE